MNDTTEAREGEVIEVAQNALAQFNEFDAELARFREEYAGRVYDLDDPAQEKQARSDRYAIGKVVSALDQRHREVKAPLLEATRLVDGRRKAIKDELLSIQGAIKAQIEEKERRERARVETLQARIGGIREIAEFFDHAGRDVQPDSAAVAERLEAARAIALDDSWQEFRPDAALARTETIETLERLHAERVTAEAEAAELERLRQEQEARERAEREEQIAREAEERARKQAEDEARKAQERHEREMAQAKAAAERAAAEERARIEAEQKRKAEEARNEQEAEDARKAAAEHRERIEREAAKSLMAHLAGWAPTTADRAGAIIEAIRDGKVAHVRIDY